MNVNFAKLQQSIFNPKPNVPLLSNNQPTFIDERLYDTVPLSFQTANNAEFEEKRANEEQNNLLRLQYDFEFVQHLVSPDYIKYLFRQGYFQKPEFLNYLEYLKYWEQPEYFKLLVNPKCIDALNLLLREEIRTEIAINNDFSNYFAF